MRGLKPKKDNSEDKIRRRIFYRCVDWNFAGWWNNKWLLGRIFYRCVDWNSDLWHLEIPVACRIFYRCVDWNPTLSLDKNSSSVASFTDAWIETYFGQLNYFSVWVASFTDAWIETGKKSWTNARYSRIFYRCVDWNLYKLSWYAAYFVASFTDAWIETFYLWGG